LEKLAAVKSVPAFILHSRHPRRNHRDGAAPDRARRLADLVGFTIVALGASITGPVAAAAMVMALALVAIGDNLHPGLLSSVAEWSLLIIPLARLIG
jgi:hypothetical protein